MNKDKALFRLEREKLLLTGEIPRLFMKYALPGVAGLLFLGIQSVIDGIVLGRFVGANALASVNLVLPCYSLISAFAIVMGSGGKPLSVSASEEGISRRLMMLCARYSCFCWGCPWW